MKVVGNQFYNGGNKKCNLTFKKENLNVSNSAFSRSISTMPSSPFGPKKDPFPGYFHSRVASTRGDDYMRTVELNMMNYNKTYTFAFKPGQWVEVHTPPIENGKTNSAIYSPEKSEKQRFSIFSTPNDLIRMGRITLAVRRTDHPTPTYLHDVASLGDPIWVDAEGHGEFWYTKERYPDIKSVVLIGGGIGITPLISILRHIYEIHYDVSIQFVQSAKTIADCLILRSIMNMTKYRNNVKANWAITGDQEIVLEDNCKDWAHLVQKKIIDKQFLKELNFDKESLFFLAGPKPLTTLAQEHLNELGVPQDRIQFETEVPYNLIE